MTRIDPHSWADSDQPRARALELSLDVDFDRRRIAGEATLELEGPSDGALDLDSRALGIREVTNEGGAAVPFRLGDEDKVLGQRLRLDLPGGTRRVRIRYEVP